MHIWIYHRPMNPSWVCETPPRAPYTEDFWAEFLHAHTIHAWYIYPHLSWFLIWFSCIGKYTIVPWISLGSCITTIERFERSRCCPRKLPTFALTDVDSAPRGFRWCFPGVKYQINLVNWLDYRRSITKVQLWIMWNIIEPKKMLNFYSPKKNRWKQQQQLKVMEGMFGSEYVFSELSNFGWWIFRFQTSECSGVL